jgi:hypothetical protein
MQYQGKIKLKNIYSIRCEDKYGNLKWTDEIHNLIPTEGLNHIINSAYVSGNSSPAIYAGLIVSGGSLSAADAMGSHSGWDETDAYSETARPTCILIASVGGGTTNSASPATFTINGTVTIYGIFLCLGSSVKLGSDGIIMGEGALPGGEKDLISGDKIFLVVTFSAT